MSTGTVTAGSAAAGPALLPTPAGPAGGGPTPAQRWRAWRTPLAIVVFVLLAGTIIALLRPAPGLTGYLSPDSTGAPGTHALADLLSARGHPVVAAGSAADAVAAAGPGTTLVLTNEFLLSRADLGRLGRTGAGLVLVEPDRAALAVLAPRVTLLGGAPVGPLPPACALRAATLAGVADLGGPGLQVAGGPGGSAQCYPDNGLPTLVRLRVDGHPVTVLSAGALLSNGYLSHQGNAALALNLLSRAGRVVWLTPSFPSGAAAGSGARSFASLIPLAARLVAIQLGLALLVTIVWRARRLGPLVPEQLPVVVRASETVEGHARLYRSRRARGRVAAALREATLSRLCPAVGLAAGAAAAVVAPALAARSTLDEARIADLLYGPAPASDAALIKLASDLDGLEGEVRTQ